MWKDIEHRSVGGVAVLRELARIQGKSNQPLMPVVFTSILGQQSASDEAAEIPLFDRKDVVYGISQTPQVWLDHQVVERAGGLHYNWDAVEELFPEGLLGEMFTAYGELLKRLASEEQVWQEERIDLLPAEQ